MGINLSPALEAQLVLQDTTIPTMCAKAGTCADVCLVKTGMNVFTQGQKTRAAKTRLWVKDPSAFIDQAVKEITLAEARTTMAGYKFAVRPNLLSDQPKLAHALARRLPDIQFYDYTKLPHPRKRVLDNYHLTYSVSERTTRADLLEVMASGINLAAVVAVPRDGALPQSMRVMGRRLHVIDGDKDDLRFLDNEGSVVALRWKGSQERMLAGIAGGFVLDPTKEVWR